MPLRSESRLSPESKIRLLDHARTAVRGAVTHGRPPEPAPKEGIFGETRSAFVTLHVAGNLRGCIGAITPEEPLGQTIAHCAASAARHDLRFAPIRPEELPHLTIEISLLSPLAPLAAADVEIGRHGLYIAQGARRGLLLPQVAIEHRLSREEFLEETCHKAGLPRHAWQEPETVILGFTCEIFSDAERGES